MSDESEETFGTITVEVAYATPEKQRIKTLDVPEGTTAFEAVQLSCLPKEFSGIDPEQDPMGIFSKRLDGKTLPLPKDYVLQALDRVEIYRPLIIDPKQARLLRAEKKAEKEIAAKEEVAKGKVQARAKLKN